MNGLTNTFSSTISGIAETIDPTEALRKSAESVLLINLNVLLDTTFRIKVFHQYLLIDVQKIFGYH